MFQMKHLLLTRDLQGGVNGIEELTEDMAVEVRTEFHKTESIFYHSPSKITAQIHLLTSCEQAKCTKAPL